MKEMWPQIWQIVQLVFALGFMVLALLTIKSNLDRGLLLMVLGMVMEQRVSASRGEKP